MEEEEVEEKEEETDLSDDYFNRVNRRISDHQRIGSFDELLAFYHNFKPFVKEGPKFLEAIEKIVGIRNKRSVIMRNETKGGGGRL